MRNACEKYIDFATIIAAKDGNVDALKYILEFYRPIIRKLAQTVITDQTGKNRVIVDEDLCSELEIKLIVAVMNFKIQM
ncbi:MAG: helix-turn-helix domain-containing protein [Peptococcaceae bacterium]|nr:helix-turn-helix domain-containing protein [Peptococcaceae bacterium]